MAMLGTKPRYASAVISCNSSGDNTIIAGVAQQTIRVFRIVLTLAAGTITIKDGASTSLTGALATNALALDPQCPGDPLFVTSAGNGLVFNLSGANQCSGVIWYAQS